LLWVDALPATGLLEPPKKTGHNSDFSRFAQAGSRSHGSLVLYRTEGSARRASAVVVFSHLASNGFLEK
jgi:hypothetical protein